MIAFAILRQKDHVVVRLLALSSLRLVVARGGREVNLAADQRLDAVRLHLAVEGDCAVDVAVIGHRARLHAEFLDALGERLDLYGPV